ncbi:MAG: protein kinase [Cyanobacteria bacterium P01_A01_bin.135]
MISFDSAISDTQVFDFDDGVLLGGRYQIIKQLAEGTFGHTYLARDWHLPDHPVCVIKQLKSQADGNDMKTAQRLFDSEARALVTLGSHKQIPHLLAHFIDGEEFFLVQEYIKGRSLHHEILPGAAWPEPRVIGLLDEILQVLSFVHQQQVIHRDIKPANLIRRYSDGKVVLIDFGAVKRASTPFSDAPEGQSAFTIAIGTAGYIPKEQIGGRPRYSSDVYAVGIVGIQALTGISPQQLPEGKWSGEIDWQGLAPHVSPELAQVLDTMVRYDFRDRFPDATAALAALRQLPAHLWQSPTPLPSLAEPMMMAVDGAPLPPTVQHITAIGASQTPTQSQTTAASATETAVTEAADIPSPRTAPPTGTTLQGLANPKPASPARPSPRQSIRQSPPAASATTQPPRPSSASMTVDHRSVSQPAYTTTATVAEAPHHQGLVEFARCQLLQWRRRHLTRWYLAAIGAILLSLLVWPLTQRRPLLAAADHTDSQELLTAAAQLVRQLPADEAANSEAFARMVQLVRQASQQESDGNHTAALDTYRQVLGIDATNLSALWGRCRMLNQLEQAEMALDACNDLLAMDAADVVGLWGVAEANSTMQLSDKALALFNQALDQHPDFAPLWKDRAELLWQIGEAEAATASLYQALALKPDYKDALALQQRWGV